MIEIILLILCLIPAMLGLAELLHSLKLYILAPKNKAISYTVICLTGYSPQQQLRFAIEKYSWMGEKSIIAVNTFVPEEDFEECREIAEKNNIIFCSADELTDAIKTIAGKII